MHAGHGTQAEDGSNYLIPVEEVEKDIFLKMSALSAQHVLERLETRGCHLNLVLLDACRNKPSRMVRSGRCALMGLSEMKAPAGSVLAFACAPGKTAGDGGGRNGVFTAHLLKHIKTPGVDVDRMLRAVARGVHDDTRGAQDPYHNHNLRQDSVCLTGTSTSKRLSVPEVADANELADWLVSACSMRADEVALTVPLLRELGAEASAELEFLSDAAVAGLSLKPITLGKLRAGVAKLGMPAPTPQPASPAATSDAAVIESIAQFQREVDFVKLVALMYAHGTKTDVQEAACKALVTLCLKLDNLPKAGGAGAVEAVVAALRAHSANAAVQEQGCWALRNICCNNADNQAKAGGAGAVEAVVAALRTHSANAAVQEQGCRALCNLCTDSADNKAKAGGAGAIEAVVAVLRAHGANLSVQEQGCAALVNLCCDNADNKVKAAGAGAIEAVVAAMRAHGSSARVQEHGCAAVGNLCANTDNEAKAAAAGAIEAVVAALRAHGSNVGVQERGCAALRNLCWTHTSNRARARAAGAVAAVNAALSAFKEGPVATNAKQALERINA